MGTVGALDEKWATDAGVRIDHLTGAGAGPTMADLMAAVKAIQNAPAAVLAAIADLKAHPAITSDPALLAAIQKIDSHFSGK